MIDIDSLLEVEGLCITDTGEYRLHWRLLTLKEYNVFRALRDGGIVPPFFLYNMVFERCYIGSLDLLSDDMPAGLCISVGELCMWMSGDSEQTSLKQDLTFARNQYKETHVIEHMKRVILLAQNNLRFSDMDDWTRPRLYKEFVMSEHLLKAKNNDYQLMDLRKISDGTERKQQQKSIDFARENAELNSKLGHREIAEQNKQTGLAPGDQKRMIAEKMDRRNRRK